ncbi:hypothetical protein ACFE04_011032 [Oxalis oulophora]
MSAIKLGSPVQTPMAVSVFNRPCKGEYHANQKGKPAGTRRVFVQTETGCVLGMELDRNDNAHTVKRRLQLALNVPTDGSSLTLGDLTLNNDLRVIRNDSPLLLTRNAMHRSSSTPCLSPTAKNLQQRDKSGPIELLVHSNQFDKSNELIKEIVTAIKSGINPILAHGGLGGAYYFKNIRGENVAIIKPTDEEPFAPNNPKGYIGKALGCPGVKPSVRVGETGFREVAAYLLDHDHFANVPPTVLVKVTHSIFNVNVGVTGNKLQNGKKVSKIASLQQFMPHDFDASDHGTSTFPVSDVHRIGILDVRIFNTDRHAGNLLVRKLDGVASFGEVELIPIDHGLCLPESLEDPYFEWIHWPQSSIPFSEQELEYIKNLDSMRDSEMLRTELPMIREACLRVLVLCTIFLQDAAEFGLCLAEIGEMMSRDFRGGEDQPSELESLCLEASKTLADRKITFLHDVTGDEECLFDIEDEITNTSHASDITNASQTSETSEDSFKEQPMCDTQPKWDWSRTASRLSLSMKKLNFDENSQLYCGQKPELCYASKLGTRRSASEQIPATTTCVGFADMGEDEWALFLEKFKELLPLAYAKRRTITIGQRQRQRLGTSCQF